MPTCRQRCRLHLCVVDAADEDDFRRGYGGADRRGRLDTVQVWQIDVHHNHVGPRGARLEDGLHAVVRDSDNFQARVLEVRDQDLPPRGVIVDDEYPDAGQVTHATRVTWGGGRVVAPAQLGNETEQAPR